MGWTNAKEENIVGRWETFGIISDFKNMKLDPESRRGMEISVPIFFLFILLGFENLNQYYSPRF